MSLPSVPQIPISTPSAWEWRGSQQVWDQRGLLALMNAPFRIRVPVIDAIEIMTFALPDRSKVLLLSPVDAEGYVVCGTSFSLEQGFPSREVLFELPRRVGATGVLFGSRATASVFDPDEFDDQLFRHLLDASEAEGIPMVEHVLVKDDMFRLMKEAGSEAP